MPGTQTPAQSGEHSKVGLYLQLLWEEETHPGHGQIQKCSSMGEQDSKSIRSFIYADIYMTTNMSPDVCMHPCDMHAERHSCVQEY